MVYKLKKPLICNKLNKSWFGFYILLPSNMKNKWPFCGFAEFNVVIRGVKETELAISLFGTKSLNFVASPMHGIFSILLRRLGPTTPNHNVIQWTHDVVDSNICESLGQCHLSSDHASAISNEMNRLVNWRQGFWSGADAEHSWPRAWPAGLPGWSGSLPPQDLNLRESGQGEDFPQCASQCGVQGQEPCLQPASAPADGQWPRPETDQATLSPRGVTMCSNWLLHQVGQHSHLLDIVHLPGGPHLIASLPQQSGRHRTGVTLTRKTVRIVTNGRWSTVDKKTSYGNL